MISIVMHAKKYKTVNNYMSYSPMGYVPIWNMADLSSIPFKELVVFLIFLSINNVEYVLNNNNSLLPFSMWNTVHVVGVITLQTNTPSSKNNGMNYSLFDEHFSNVRYAKMC